MCHTLYNEQTIQNRRLRGYQISAQAGDTVTIHYKIRAIAGKAIS